ncbi:PREDICTED: extensin-like [Vollenhovia emeryi]|uniref:extensin-like n=1 Tax=Vollenhovia emeryi TaxID=411798 RepID=UPI0005F3999A|nr:PREDICTED: extensin-like [Vollenhovia emeryi]
MGKQSHYGTICAIACSMIALALAKPAPEPPVSSYFPPSGGGGGGGGGGGYGPPADRYGPPQQNPVIHKHVYVHVPPPEAPEYKPPKHYPQQQPQKHYKIVFIKAPTPPTPTAPQLPPLPQPDEEKTLIYVLVKKPEEAPEIVLPTQAPTQPSKPEVYFIRYKTQKEQGGGEYGPPGQQPGQPIDSYGAPHPGPSGPY